MLVFLFCLRDGRGSNRAAAHSAASNQPSGLLLSPRVPTRRNVYRGSCKSKDFMAFLFCKPWVHGFCTVFARSVLSMSDYVGRCIALQSVPFFCVSRNQGVTHTTLLAKSCAKGVRVATGAPHPFGNPRETPINCAAHTRPVR